MCMCSALGLILTGSCYGGDPTASVVAAVAYIHIRSTILKYVSTVI